MKKIIPVISTLLISLFLATACMTTTTRAGEVGADRSQLMLYSQADVETVSRQSYEEVLQEAKANGTLNKNATELKRVQEISKKIIAQTGTFRSDAPSWNWQINVITDKTVNAWCLPGGRIVVYTGIIDSLKLTDAELAAVIGHEISHALREHSREQMSRQAVTTLGAAAVASILRLGDAGYNLIQLGSQLILTLPFSRSQETEADNIGTELMARAGYNPYEAAKIWEKMNKVSGAQPAEIFSTHPSNNSRIENLNQIAAKVYPLYEKSSK